MNIVAEEKRIPAMSRKSIEKVRELEQQLLSMPQVEIKTEHAFHAGLYARTIKIPAGCALSGAEITVDTVLILSGHATMAVDGGSVELDGYHVIQASAQRKQAFIAHSDTYLTMLFHTKASTIEDAENEFTNEPNMLGSRRERI